MASLDEILNDKEPEKPAETPETPPQEVEKVTSNRAEWRKQEYTAQGRDPETGQFVAKEKEPEPKVETVPEKPITPPVPKQEFSDKEKAFLRTAEEERRKRQSLEQKIAELEKRLEKPAEPPKPFWDDPEGAVGKLKKEIEDAKLEARQEALKSHLRTTEALARSRYSDFDEKIALFGEMVQTIPGLQAQWLNAVDPADFAYKTAKNKKDLEDAGGLDGMRQKLEIEIRAKIEKELAEKEAKIREERAKLPPSLTDTRSVAPTKPVWSGPTSMDEILGRG